MVHGFLELYIISERHYNTAHWLAVSEAQTLYLLISSRGLSLKSTFLGAAQICWCKSKTTQQNKISPMTSINTTQSWSRCFFQQGRKPRPEVNQDHVLSDLNHTDLGKDWLCNEEPLEGSVLISIISHVDTTFGINVFFKNVYQIYIIVPKFISGYVIDQLSYTDLFMF